MRFLPLVAATGAVASILIVFAVMPSVRQALIPPNDRLNITPNTQLSDNQIISKTNTIPAIQSFIAKHPNPRVTVERGYQYVPNQPLVYVHYSNITNPTDNPKNGTIEAGMDVVLSASAIYANDDKPISVFNHCGTANAFC